MELQNQNREPSPFLPHPGASHHEASSRRVNSLIVVASARPWKIPTPSLSSCTTPSRAPTRTAFVLGLPRFRLTQNAKPSPQMRTIRFPSGLHLLAPSSLGLPNRRSSFCPTKSPLPPTLCTSTLKPSWSQSPSPPIHTPMRPISWLLKECVLSESHKASSILTDSI